MVTRPAGCPTPNCPAELASAPRRYHVAPCPYAAARSGKSGPSGGGPQVRLRHDLADEMRRIKREGLEDEALAKLKTIKKEV